MQEGSASAKRPSALTIDRAAFLLLRVKRAFKKKRQQRKEKHAAAVAASVGARRVPPPLLRSRTLPAIVAPPLSILHAQIDPAHAAEVTQSQQLSRGISSHRISCVGAALPRVCINDEGNEAGEVRRKSAFSHLGVSPRSSFAVEHADGCTIRVGSASPRGSVSSSAAAARIPQDHERRLSWERECSSALPRSGSIDSVVEASTARVRRSEPNAGITLQLPRPERALSLASPAVGRRAKPHRAQAELQYGALVEGCAGELPSLSACAPPARPRAKDLDTHIDTRTQIDIHQQALFAAVEHGYLDKARNILDSTDVDVNSINTDGLSPLDVAVLTGNRPLANMLMEFGAKEGGQFKSPEALGAHLRKLCREAEARLREFGGTREPLPPTTTGCAGAASERDKQLQHWDRRHRTLKRLASGWSAVRSAGALPPPGVEVCGPHAVCVRVPALRDARHAHSPIITKYKVEWSSRNDFSNVCGTREVSACTLSGAGAGRVLISGLTRGRRYYYRVAAGNLRGWNDPTVSLPRSVVPSSWRDVSTPASRGETGKTDEQLDALATACAGARRASPGGAGAAALTAAGNVAAARARKNTIRQLFTGSKFHKHLRRGVYLACVVYQEERVLVTSEEFIPVVEVDETGPPALGSELHWLMKVSCAWPDVKSLRTDLQKHPSPSLHFRRRLLAAVAHMQASLSLMDLGQVYPTPLRDAAGTLVISLVSAARAGKPPALNSRWVALQKLRRRGLGDDNTIADLLLGSLHDQIRYHQVSRAALPRGLYVGYLKLQASVEEVRVVVPASAPNVPPHTRLRDNPHVSAEEWQYLKSQSGRTDDSKSVSNMSVSSEHPSECQEMFLQQVSAGARRLFRDMELPADSTRDHRFYDLEVVELSGDVSFIMLCPPAGRACCVPGEREMLLQRAGLLSLPVQAFEMIHLQTYRPHLLAKFCRLSCLLELDVALAAHSHREAFSCDELNTAKEKLTRLEDLQNDLNSAWKAERWLMDLIGFARDKDKSGPGAGVLLEHILDRSLNSIDGTEKDVNLKIDLLQIPARDGKINKTSPGRGSWPGPGGSGHATLHPEFSKSEQQLSAVPRQPSASTLNLSSHYLATENGQFKRKGSGDSLMTQSSNYMSGGSQFDVKSSGSSPNGRLPPSRSEDTLVLHNDPCATSSGRPHSISASLPSASPLLDTRGLCTSSMVNVHGHESAQSLSSDSDCHSCPKLRVTPSESMASLKSDTNVKKALPEATEEDKKGVKAVDEGETSGAAGGILQVFAAYETGLAAGTSLKLHVTARTTAREVIELVVKQLNMAALLRARRGPLYPPHRLPDFCLVAVIGARERCLRDDFRPLQLQNPWRRGRLYVRLKHDVLAALTHSATQPAYI